MRFEQDTACRGTHCASTPQPSALQQRSRLEEVVEEEVDSSLKDIDVGQRRRRRELEANVVEGANTGPRAEAGGPGMAYPASATALNTQHSAFAATSIAGTPPANPNGHISGGHLPAPAAPRPTDFSVSSLLTAATTHPPILGGSSSQGSASPPPGGPGSPAAAPETPPPLPSQRELSHPSSAVAAASYFSAAALAAAGFYNPAAHLPATSSPGPTAHHLQGKGILSGTHHHPHLNPHGITPPGNDRCNASTLLSSLLPLAAEEDGREEEGIVFRSGFLVDDDGAALNRNVVLEWKQYWKDKNERERLFVLIGEICRRIRALLIRVNVWGNTFSKSKK